MVALTVPSLLWRLFSVRAPKVPFLDDPSLDVSIQINMVRFVFKYTIFWPMTNSMFYIYSFTDLFSSTAPGLNCNGADVDMVVKCDYTVRGCGYGVGIRCVSRYVQDIYIYIYMFRNDHIIHACTYK